MRNDMDRSPAVRRQSRVLPGLLVLLLCLSSAGISSPLTIPKVSALAIERSLSIQAARQQTSAARHALQEASAMGAGRIDLIAEYHRLDGPLQTQAPPITIPKQVPVLGGQTFQVPPVRVAPEDLIHLKLQAGYPLYTGGVLNSLRDQAQSGVHAYEALQRDAVDAAVYQACSLLLNVDMTQQVVRVQEAALEAYRGHLDNARKAYQAGAVAQYDVIRAEAAVAEQERRLTDARNQHALACAALRAALNWPEDQVIDVAADIPPRTELPAVDTALTLADTHNPILSALDFRLSAQQAAERFTRAGASPQITAIGQMQLWRENMAQTDPKWLVGVQASVEVFDGGVRQARIAQRRDEQERTRSEKQLVRNQIRLAIESARLEMDSAHSALAAAQQSLTLSREALRLASRRFEAGAGVSLEVLDATVAVAAAETAIHQARWQMNQAYLKMHRYLGDIISICTEWTL